MFGKLEAVPDRLPNPDFVAIARTDAIAVEGFDTAADRCGASQDALALAKKAS